MSIPTTALEQKPGINARMKGVLLRAQINMCTVMYFTMCGVICVVACRLGLGAVPPADPKTQTYNKQLERRIRRKVMGQRVGQFSTEMGKLLSIHLYTCPLTNIFGCES